MPRIILLLMYDRLPKKEVKFTRHNIFERDKNTCQYCGDVFDRKDLNLDHVIPRDRGGPTTWENIVCSCIECNTQQGQPHAAGSRAAPRPQTQAAQVASVRADQLQPAPARQLEAFH